MADTYQLTITNSEEISLILSDQAVEAHASTHLTAGTDPIRLATNAREGLASAAHITAIETATSNISSLTTAVGVNTADIADIQSVLGGGSGVASISPALGSPITVTGTTSVAIGIPASSSTVNGYMSAAQAQKLAGISTGATANAINVSSPLETATVSGTQTISLPAATTSANGYLSASDKIKLDSITNGATLSGLTVSSPLVKGGTTAVPTLSIPAASTSVNGYMSSSDKTKLNTLVTTDATTSASGYMSGADKTKLDGVTAGASITAITVSSPLVKTGTTAPALSIQAATTSQNGYLSSTDKTKLDSLTAVAPQVTKTFYAGPLSGSDANPTFRAIATTDLPTVAIAQGGTAATTKTAAIANLGFKYGRATVTAGSVAIADTAITANSIIVATQEFMGTSSAPVGTSSDLVIEWCTKNSLGETIVAARELVKNSGPWDYAVDPWSNISTTFTSTDFLAFFRSPTKDLVTENLTNLGYDFTDQSLVSAYAGGLNYDVEAIYDLDACTGTISAATPAIASNTWGVSTGGTIIIEPDTNHDIKIILVREPTTNKWTNPPHSNGSTYSFTDQSKERCYWTPHGFVPSNTSSTVSDLNFPSTVQPQSIYINGVATNVMFPRLRLASDVIVNNTPSTLNRISVAKTAGTGFTIYSSNTVDTHVVDYVSYTP